MSSQYTHADAALHHPTIKTKHLTGFCMISGLFIAGLGSNIVVASKIVAIWGLTLPASVFVWAFTFPCSDIVTEVYGRKFANKMVFGGFIAFIFAILVIQSSVHMPEAPFWPNQDAYETVLSASLRISIAAIISYVVTQFLDVYVFSILRHKLRGKHLWIRNNLSTLISQTTTNTLFLSLAFLGTFPMDKWFELFTNNLMVRYGLAFSDTALVYFGVFILYKIYPDLKQIRAIQDDKEKRQR